MLEDIVTRFVNTLKLKIEEVGIVPVCNKENDYVITVGEGYCQTLIYCRDTGLNITASDYRKEYKYWWEFDINKLEEITDVILQIHTQKEIFINENR